MSNPGMTQLLRTRLSARSCVTRIDGAYLWMRSEFETRMKKHVASGLVWLWFGDGLSPGRIEGIRRKDDEHLVHLRVPVSEVLLSLHADWQHVLWDDQIPNLATRGKAVLEPVTKESKLASWNTIFDISPTTDVDELQGVVDRIEPEWVDTIEALPLIQRYEVGADRLARHLEL